MLSLSVSLVTQLQKQLKEDGKKLLKPPSCVEDLLNFLSKVHFHLESVLTRPIKSTKDALQPLMKALMAEELLLHPNKDVKTYVTSCICEVLRITKPDFPYGCEVMQKIFKQIVEAFEELPNASNLSYQVVEILKSFSKARLYKEMMNLGFDALITKMFNLFVNNFRAKLSDHSPEVFSYMETIMSSILKESDKITPEILFTLIFSVRNANQNVSPFCFKLGVKVLTNCADKLGSDLIQEVLSLSLDLEYYSQIVTSICQNASPTFKQDYLEKQLKEDGKKLLKPRSRIECLLDDLVKANSHLKRVLPRPMKSTKEALEPLMKALIAEGLILHTSNDVKLYVTSCICEVARITAPDPPYSREIMQIIFRQIVGVFQELPNVSSISYLAVVETLKAFSKTGFSKWIVNLECDASITTMFELFLNNIRSEHSPEVFSYMDTIMCSILKESEEISPEILSALLNSVRNENQNFSPLSFKLGEKVLTNCADKLNSDLLQAVGSLGIDLENYAQIVTSICQNASEKPNENLVGCNIQIRSPKNKRFNDGVVDHFDPVGKKLKGQSIDPPTPDVSPNFPLQTPSPLSNTKSCCIMYTRISRHEKQDKQTTTFSLVGPTGPNETVEIGTYKVKPNNAPTLSTILNKYGDIAAPCIYKSPSIRSSLLEVICDIVHRLQNDEIALIISNLKVVENEISDAEAAKIDVSWLRQHLAKIHEVKGFSQRAVSLKGTKVNSDLVIKVAAREMEERRAELVAARERFEERERCVKAMKIVSEKIDDEIIESEAEEYFWRRRLNGLL